MHKSAKADLCGGRFSIARQDRVAHDRINLAVPALAGKHAVVPDARLHVVALAVGLDAAAQILRRQRLAERADVVALALDRQQRGLADRLRLDEIAAKFQLALWQPELLENPLHGLEIEFGG